jgi:hypothetical protein
MLHAQPYAVEGRLRRDGTSVRVGPTVHVATSGSRSTLGRRTVTWTSAEAVGPADQVVVVIGSSL